MLGYAAGWLPPIDQLLINSSYVALVIGAFCQSMLRVRLLLILSSVLFIGFGVVMGIWPMVLWNGVIGSLHLHRLGAGLQAKRLERAAATMMTANTDPRPVMLRIVAVPRRAAGG